MRILNDHIQYQMLLDALNFSSNSMIWLPLEFINSCKTETIVNDLVANDLITTVTDISKQDCINFLLAIPFAADSTHMEGLTRTGNDVAQITNGVIQLQPFRNAAGSATTCVNVWDPRRIVFSSVCDWNLIMTANTHPCNEKCYVTNAAFNI
jgi:hypothetical protein